MGLTLLADNKVIDASFSMVVGTENTQFPLTNITHPFTTKVFRSNEDSVEILITLDQSLTIDSFALVGSSISGIGITDISIQGSGSTNFTGATVIPVDVNGEYNFGFKLFTPEGSFRFWKLTINNTGGDYVELSNIFLGVKTQLTTNGFATSSFQYSRVENNGVTQNKFGQKFIDIYNTIQVMSGSIQHANQAEFEDIDGVFLMSGTSTPLWVIADPDGVLSTDSEFLYSGYFYLQNNVSWSMSGVNLFNTELILNEAT